MKYAKIVSAMIAGLIAAPIFAQGTNTPNITKRQEIQQKRIAAGVNNGELTGKETVNLEKREAKIEADKQAAKADGKVTAVERAKLQNEENRTSRKIHRKKHNVRVASAS